MMKDCTEHVKTVIRERAGGSMQDTSAEDNSGVMELDLNTPIVLPDEDLFVPASTSEARITPSPFPEMILGSEPSEQTILITGGTGTFGHAFVPVALERYKKVVVLSRDELKQAQMQAEFPDVRFYLGDVRDKDRLIRAFREVDVVVHAAAYKRIERSALDIGSFLDVNVIGTRNVLMAAHDCGVSKVVVLSSDKACSSATPYGATKSLAEWLAINANVYGNCRSMATRYGNVECSRGSVSEIWEQRAKSGLPLQITHPLMSRFWMSIEEAVNLVLFALDNGRGGEVFIPKNIRRGKIVDFARKVQPGAEIEFIGKRGYEKLTEELVSAEEVDRLVDVGDAYVLLPHREFVRWAPLPYGMCEWEGQKVDPSFRYRSDADVDI